MSSIPPIVKCTKSTVECTKSFVKAVRDQCGAGAGAGADAVILRFQPISIDCLYCAVAIEIVV